MITLLKFGCAFNTQNLPGKYRGVVTALTDNRMCWSCTPKGVAYSVTPQICVLQHPFCLHSTLGLFVLWIHWLSSLHCLLLAPQRNTTTSISECFVWHLIGIVACITLLSSTPQKGHHSIFFRVLKMTPHRISCSHNTSAISAPQMGHHSILF